MKGIKVSRYSSHCPSPSPSPSQPHCIRSVYCTDRRWVSGKGESVLISFVLREGVSSTFVTEKNVRWLKAAVWNSEPIYNKLTNHRKKWVWWRYVILDMGSLWPLIFYPSMVCLILLDGFPFFVITICCALFRVVLPFILTFITFSSFTFYAQI